MSPWAPDTPGTQSSGLKQYRGVSAHRLEPAQRPSLLLSSPQRQGTPGFHGLRTSTKLRREGDLGACPASPSDPFRVTDEGTEAGRGPVLVLSTPSVQPTPLPRPPPRSAPTAGLEELHPCVGPAGGQMTERRSLGGDGRTSLSSYMGTMWHGHPSSLFFCFKCTHDAWSWAAILAPCGEASGQKLKPTTYFQTHFLFKPPLGFLLLETKTWTLLFQSSISLPARLSCPKVRCS